MSNHNGVRLSRIVIVGGIAVSTLALIAAVACIVLTSLMREGTETVEAANHVVRSAVELHDQVVSLARDAANGGSATEGREATIARALAAAKSAATADDEPRLVNVIEANVREHFAMSGGSGSKAGNGPLQAALSASDALVNATSERAATIETRVRLWDVSGTIIGVVVGLLTLIGVPAVLLGVHRLFTRPMLRLGAAIRAFGGGDKSARAPASGPAEFVAVASAFNELGDALMRQDEQRLAFLGGVAHDLRNPLSALRMALYFVQPNRPLPGERKLRDTLDLVTRQVTRLDRMLGDFLDAVRIQRGELDLRLEHHDLRELARNTVELYANASRAHSVVLSAPHEAIDVAVDAMRIEQVLNNLVSNAIKYSPNGGEVSVAVRSDSGAAIIEVHDHGVGISQADQERVFEPFRRNRGTTELAPGVGLGLSVARRIVEAHMGSIEIESVPDGGSTFRVRLPLPWSEQRSPKDDATDERVGSDVAQRSPA